MQLQWWRLRSGTSSLLLVLMQVVRGMRGLALAHAEGELPAFLDDLIGDEHRSEHEGTFIAGCAPSRTEDHHGIDEHSTGGGYGCGGFKVRSDITAGDTAGLIRAPGAF